MTELERHRALVFLMGVLLPFMGAKAQLSRIFEDVQYSVMAQGTAGGGDVAPFWFTNNRYGLGTTNNNSGLFTLGIGRDVATDAERHWQVGYGLEVASPINPETGYFCVQQAFLDIRWKMIGLSLGQKQRPSELKNEALSTGGMTLGINARPIPQVRLEMPDFWAIPGTRGIFSFKAHIAYGFYTDNKWQRDFNAGTSNLYTANSLFHSKALLLRFGNRELFPLEVSGGIEMACQFGGKGWNVSSYVGDKLNNGINLGGSIWDAFYPGGGDVNDDVYTNAAGNHLGSWHLRLDWKAKGWSVGAYMEHFFEDHSQLVFQYGWKDMLLGVEANLPKNPVLSTLVFEYNSTMHQSGPIYHDKTEEYPQQISARDNYYGNHIYGGWQMAGFMIGNPLILSPIYNPYFGAEGSLRPQHNRLRVYHVGLMGSVNEEWSWRALYTHQKSLGTYGTPLPDPKYGNYLMLEATYSPRWCKGLAFTGAYGHNNGELLGSSNGALLSIKYVGFVTKSKK